MRQQRFVDVSIHTRHYWRVKHQHSASPSTLSRFNPHPPLLAGETIDSLLTSQGAHVSIHTRHYWRVKHRDAARRAVNEMFQSTPAITGG